MASSKGRKYADSKSKKFKFIGFHNVIPTDEEKIEFKESPSARNISVVDSLIVCAEQGCKTSFSFDTWRDAYVFSITAKTTGTGLDGYCLTFYHKEAETSILFGSWDLRRKLDSGETFIAPPSDALDW